MRTLKFIVPFLIFGLPSCGQNSKKTKIDPVAVQLNNQAMSLVAHIDNRDSSIKALTLLDQATTIDSNYFLGHYNKLMFLNKLDQYERATKTLEKLIQLQPKAQDLYLTAGIVSEKFGDTISSRTYFENALAICNSALDTMNTNNRDYEMLLGNKAVALIMLDDKANGNEILLQIYNRQTDRGQKKWTASLMNKSKSELVTFLLSDQYRR